MMHYGFCRKHADQTGEGGCPECAMDHQQSTILAMTETAKEANRVHIEMHNTIQAQAEELRITKRHLLDAEAAIRGYAEARIAQAEELRLCGDEISRLIGPPCKRSRE